MSTPKPGFVRPSWAEVQEDHEWFDGEVEIAASAKQAWRNGRYDRPKGARRGYSPTYR